MLGVIILTSLGTWGLPQMIGKFYAIKSEKSVQTGMIVSTFFAVVVSGGCYFLGGFGRLFSDKVDIVANGYDSIIPTVLSTLPDILIGVVIVLVLSASMLTLSSLVLTSSSTLTIDFLEPVVLKKKDEKKQVFTMRIFIIVYVAISVAIALNKDKIPNIAQLMGYSWGALAGAFTMLVSLALVPLVSIITPKPDAKATDELFECFETKVEVSIKNALD